MHCLSRHKSRCCMKDDGRCLATLVHARPCTTCNGYHNYDNSFGYDLRPTDDSAFDRQHLTEGYGTPRHNITDGYGAPRHDITPRRISRKSSRDYGVTKCSDERSFKDSLAMRSASTSALTLRDQRDECKVDGDVTTGYDRRYIGHGLMDNVSMRSPHSSNHRRPSHPDTRRRFLPQTPAKPSNVARDYYAVAALPNSLHDSARFCGSNSQHHSLQSSFEPFVLAEDQQRLSNIYNSQDDTQWRAAVREDTARSGLDDMTSRQRPRSGSERAPSSVAERSGTKRRCSSPIPGRRALPSLDVVARQRVSSPSQRRQQVDSLLESDELPCFSCSPSTDGFVFEEDSIYEEEPFRLKEDSRNQERVHSAGTFRSRIQSELVGNDQLHYPSRTHPRARFYDYDDSADETDREKSRDYEEEKLLSHRMSLSAEHMSEAVDPDEHRYYSKTPTSLSRRNKNNVSDVTEAQFALLSRRSLAEVPGGARSKSVVSG